MKYEKLKKRYQKYACPICGELPYIQVLYDLGDKRPGKRAADWNQYKAHCPNHHLDCGDWKESKLAAWKDWLKRRVDTTQPDLCFNDNDFTIRNMNIDELADFLFRWQRNAVGVMCCSRLMGKIGIPTNALFLKSFAEFYKGRYDESTLKDCKAKAEAIIKEEET